MRSFRHWTCHYTLDRTRLWYYQHVTARGAPWLTPEANRRLDAWLEPHFRGLEWGAGRSTLWFAQRIAHFTSIEHDPTWHRKVHRLLQRRRFTHAALLLIEEHADTYVRACDEERNAALDFALIDGRRRDECALAVIPKIRPGGWLVVDDIQRYLPSDSRSPGALGRHAAPLTDRWQEIARISATWPLIWTTSGVSDTAIWQRP